jgi:hypothetical protein
MPKIKIDELEYHTENLTENGRAQLESLQFLEGQLQRIRNEIAVYETAQRSYVAELKVEIEKNANLPEENPN